MDESQRGREREASSLGHAFSLPHPQLLIQFRKSGKVMTCFNAAKINLLLPLEIFMGAKWKTKIGILEEHLWIWVKYGD